jgi:acyl CoA:acetate/3-ketoacid CoA transferase beta subunit
VRLPGAGGAPEIATSCREVIVVLQHHRRAFVDRVDFVTSAGYLSGGDERARRGLPGKGPVLVITDLGLLRPDPETNELVLTSVHPGVDPDEVRKETGWPLRVAERLEITVSPNDAELGALRALVARTQAARRGGQR